jgi:uncharacterized membrane protein
MSASISRTWAVVLVLSVAINLFLVAVIGTAWLHRHYARGYGGYTFSVPWSLHVVGDDIRPLAREIFRSKSAEFAENRKAIGADRQRLADLLAARQFDRAAFAAALAHMRQDSLKAQETVHDGMVELAEKLTFEQRRALVKSLEARAKRFAERRERWERRRREAEEKDD